MSTPLRQKFRTLTRSDLQGFDDPAKRLILDMMEVGAQGRVSSKGHAIIRSLDGRATMSVVSKVTQASRSWANQMAEARRLFPELFEAKVADARDMADLPHCSLCSSSTRTLEEVAGVRVCSTCADRLRRVRDAQVLAGQTGAPVQPEQRDEPATDEVVHEPEHEEAQSLEPTTPEGWDELVKDIVTELELRLRQLSQENAQMRAVLERLRHPDRH